MNGLKANHSKVMNLLGFKRLNNKGTFTPYKGKKTRNDTIHTFNLDAKMVAQIPPQEEGVINHGSDHDCLVFSVKHIDTEVKTERI